GGRHVGDLERDVPFDLGQDLLPDGLRVLVFLRDQRRVRRHPRQHAPPVDLADLVDTRRIEEQPHMLLPFCARPASRSSPARSVARSMTRSMTEASAWSKLKFGITGTPWVNAWLRTYRCSFRMFSNPAT